MLSPKSKIVNQLHAVSAAAKAKASWFATQAIGSVRHFLGGHGYSSYSRLGRLYFDQELNTTWEGDNHMLLQQTLKYVLKTVQKLRGKADPSNLLNFVNDVSIRLYRKYPCLKIGLKKVCLRSKILKKSSKKDLSICTMKQ